MVRKPITSSYDVVTYLTAQHDAIRTQFTETVAAKNDRSQQAAFSRLQALLAVHEAAEAVMVHPRVRRKINGGNAIADARLTEEHDVKIALDDLARVPLGTAEFSSGLVSLQNTVLEHAAREEREEFALLAEYLDGDELTTMTTAVQLAERIESGFVDVAPEPPRSVVDRARAFLRGGSGQTP